MKKILFIMIFLLTGCVKYSDLSEITIIKSIGISYDNNYHIYAQIIDSIDENNEPQMKIIESSKKDFKDSFNNLNNLIDKEIFLSHIDLLVLDINLSDENYQEIINYFLINNKLRNDFYCVFSNDTKTLLEKSKYDEIEIFLKASNKSVNIKIFNDVIKDYIDNKIITLPNLAYNEKIVFNDIFNSQERIINEKEN